MTEHEQQDPLVALLAQLPLATSDSARAERVRARCRARLRRYPGSKDPGLHRVTGLHRAPELQTRRLESVLIGGFSAIYFAGVILDLLRWHNML
jgi:hypothetical protein